MNTFLFWTVLLGAFAAMGFIYYRFCKDLLKEYYQDIGGVKSEKKEVMRTAEKEEVLTVWVLSPGIIKK